jgi:hypothetical protein
MKKLILATIGLGLMSYLSHAQQFKMSQGVSITEYQFINELGVPVQGIRAASGISTQASFHKANLFDKDKMNVEQGKIALFLAKNPTLFNLLSKLNYDLGIQYLQMNAVGDIQKNAFSYQNDCIGLQGKFGLRINLPFKFSVNIQTVIMGQKMLYGTQFVNGRYVNLAEDPQFSSVKALAGFGGEFERKFSERLTGFFAYQQSQTLSDSALGQTSLNFKPVVFSLGFRIFN